MSRSTIAYINSQALQHNLQVVRQRAPLSQIAAVIKADGYGHGLLAVANALQSADILAVATVDEAMRLRHIDIDNDILVLEGFNSSKGLSLLQQHNIIPVVHAKHQLSLLSDGKRLKAAWLKLNTGMHRLGFPANEAVKYHTQLQAHVDTPLVLMTHLANAEQENISNAQQVTCFDASINELSGLHSIANSAATWSLPETRRDWVRPGILLYGISPFPQQIGSELGLQPAMQLYSELIAMHDCKQGDAIGYGSRYICKKDTKIGVVAIGYGDGYPRHARDGTPVWVAGQRAEVVGWPSMDMLNIALPLGSKAKVGDKVEIWGKNIAVEEVAKYTDTIPYELVCQVKSRVKFEVI